MHTSPLDLQKHSFPWCTYLLILLNTSYFIVMITQGVHWLKPQTLDLLQWGGNFTYLFLSGESWRIISNTFVHAGIIHLGSNLIALWFLGKEFERLVGHRSFLIIYMGGGLLASINSMYWHNQEVMVGASGSIFALFGGLLAVISTAEGRRIQRAQEKSGTLIQWMLFALLSGFTAKNTDNAAHFGGLISGFLLGLLLSRAYTAERLQFKIKPSWRMLAIVLVLAIYFCIPFYFKPPPLLQFNQWYQTFDQAFTQEVDQLAQTSSLTQQKLHWQRNIQPKFQRFHHYFEQFLQQVKHNPSQSNHSSAHSSAHSFDHSDHIQILHDAEATSLTRSERAYLITVSSSLKHLKKGLTLYFSASDKQEKDHASMQTWYHIWLGRKYKTLIHKQQINLVLDKNWNEALFFAQDLDFFKGFSKELFMLVMNDHIWKQITSSRSKLKQDEYKTFYRALIKILTLGKYQANLMDTLSVLLHRKSIDHPTRVLDLLVEALTLSQHSHQLDPHTAIFNQQIIRLLLYSHTLYHDRLPSWIQSLTLTWSISPSSQKVENKRSKMGRRRTSTNTHRQHQKKQIKNQSKKITHTYLGNEDTHKEKIPTLTVDTQSKVDWSKHNNQGYVLYAMRTADLKKWQSSSYQSKLRDFTQLEQPLKPTIPLIRIYIPLRIQLPLQLPYFTYEHRMVSESNPSTTPDDLRGAVPPKNTSLSSHQTSERILSFAYPKHTSLATPPYMSNVKLVAKEFLTAIPSVASSYFTQEWQVIYAQALIPAPPSTYWTLSHSLR